ncbi:MAG: hypothetical protein IPO53_14725 [Chitinophagaceae bacterium]|nr:hypothetical protein [Chitinophagaceae bacterium]
MVEKFNLTGFKNIFFETYLAYVIAAHIFTDPVVNKKVGMLKRKLLAVMVFFQINWKLFFKFIRKLFKWGNK